MVDDRRYHHGNLRRALLDAGLELAAARGPDGFSLREAARRAGVSHAAPYHHFADRAALLAALARESFELLDAHLRDAADAVGNDARARTDALLHGYVRFAFEHPARFRLMWRHDPGRPQDIDAVRERTGEQPTFALLAETLQAAQREGRLEPWEDDPDASRRAAAVWAAIHGATDLLLSGQLGPVAPADTANDIGRLIWGLR